MASSNGNTFGNNDDEWFISSSMSTIHLISDRVSEQS
jgi:hypothetical protein